MLSKINQFKKLKSKYNRSNQMLSRNHLPAYIFIKTQCSKADKPKKRERWPEHLHFKSLNNYSRWLLRWILISPSKNRIKYPNQRLLYSSFHKCKSINKSLDKSMRSPKSKLLKWEILLITSILILGTSSSKKKMKGAENSSSLKRSNKLHRSHWSLNWLKPKKRSKFKTKWKCRKISAVWSMCLKSLK